MQFHHGHLIGNWVANLIAAYTPDYYKVCQISIFWTFNFTKICTVDSRYSLIANSGKSRFSGFFQVTKTKMDFMKRILLRIADFSNFQ